MPEHWTYEDLDGAAELAQGDILQPTAELKHIFSEVHRHFCDDKYLGFLITTQSCDLVRRSTDPKAAYINIAVIRPLHQVIHKILAHKARSVGPQRFAAGDKGESRRLLERVLNQNEQAIGLFFLHTDVHAGIAEPAVAFLRVTIALRTDHYEALRSARVGRLTAEFRAKLGWLVGNLYVRPATRDWSDRDGGEKELKSLVNQYVGEARWVDEEILRSAKEKGVDVSTAPPELLESLRPPSSLDRALEEIRAELTRVDPEIEPGKVTKLQNRLRNSGKFTKLF